MNDSGNGIKKSHGEQSKGSTSPGYFPESVPTVHWPNIDETRLSTADARRRRRQIGGSDAITILSGDRERILELWLEKRGLKEPADLSDDLSVMLGCWTEPFNRQWFERLTGKRVTDCGKQFVCARHHWRRCTVDG